MTQESNTETVTSTDEELTDATGKHVFELAQDPEKITDAMRDTDITIGRNERGLITTIGLMGAPGYTSNPDDVTFSDDYKGGSRFIRSMYREIDDLDLDATITFPSEINGRSKITGDKDWPYNEYQFDVYINPDGNVTALTDFNDTFIQSLRDGFKASDSLRVVTIDHSDTTIGGKFRGVYPWVKHEKLNVLEGDGWDADVPEDMVYDVPDSIVSLISELRESPKLPKSYVTKISVYEFSEQLNSKYSDVADVAAFEEFTSTNGKSYSINTGSGTERAEHVESIDTRESGQQFTYQLTVNVPCDSVEKLKKEYNAIPEHVSNIDEYVEWVCESHFEANHGRGLNAHVGILNSTKHRSHSPHSYTYRTIITTID